MESNDFDKYNFNVSKRFFASIIDIVLYIFLSICLSILAIILLGNNDASLGGAIVALVYLEISLIFVPFTYTTISTLLFSRTFGKALFGLKVIDMNGARPNVLRIVVRQLLWSILFAMSIYLIGLVGFASVLADKNGRSWYDKIAGTKVVDSNIQN